jgi:hypothetical protein
MNPFGESFRGENKQLCALSASDSQADSSHCVEMRKLVKIQGTYEDIFTEDFSPDLVKTLVNIFNFREKLRKLNS